MAADISFFAQPPAAQARPVAVVWADQGCGPSGYPQRRRSHDQPSRRTLIWRALGKSAGDDGLIVRKCCGVRGPSPPRFMSPGFPWGFSYGFEGNGGPAGSITGNAAQAENPLYGEPTRIQSTASMEKHRLEGNAKLHSSKTDIYKPHGVASRIASLKPQGGLISTSQDPGHGKKPRSSIPGHPRGSDSSINIKIDNYRCSLATSRQSEQ